VNGARIVRGAAIAIIEPEYAREIRERLARPSGRGSAPAHSSAERTAQPPAASLGEFAGHVSSALRAVAGAWVTAQITHKSTPDSGNVFRRLQGAETAMDAVIFAGAAAKIGEIPPKGNTVMAHVARVSLYQQRGQLSLVIDALRDGIMHQLLHARIYVRRELPLVVGDQAAFEASQMRLGDAVFALVPDHDSPVRSMAMMPF
jgi:OB-fold nucleic acid binding domain